MSSSVDERIVKLGFDNGKFEKGVSQSMSTLDKLEEKLKFKHADEGTKNLQRAFDGFDFSVMSRGIESLERRFSTMGIAGMNVVNKITDSIIGAAKKIESATIGQIKAGGWSRAMNLANAQFQIEGLGEDWNEMQKAISYGVKDTAYGLDAAASAASSLVASGVAYKESIEGANDSLMHTSLRAISGVAAMTNSSYEDISRIFTTVAGNGRLMGDQLLQLSSRGLNVAANLANAFGKTEAEIRDMVSHGQIDFETFAKAMDDAFGAHAKEANKTFTGALSNMKAALSRFGAVFATPVIEKTNTLFISLTSRIDELKGKLNSVRVPKSMEELHKELDNLNLTAAGFDAVSKSISEKTIDFGKDFADMWQSGIDAFSALIKAVDLSWFDTIVEKVDIATNKVKWFFDTLKDYLTDSSEDTAKEVNDAAKSMMVSAEEAAAARDVIAGKYGTGASRANKLKELFGEQSAKNIQTYVNAVAVAGWDYEKSAVKIEEASEKIELSEEELAKKEKLKGIFDNLKNSGNNFLAAAKNIAIVITSVGKAIFKGFGFNVSSAGSMLEKVSSVVLKISYKIGTYVLPLLNSITVGVSNLWRAAKTVGGSLKTILSSIFAAFSSVFKIDTGSISKGIVNVTGFVDRLSKKLIISEDGASKIYSTSVKFFTAAKQGLSFVWSLLKKVPDVIDKIANSKLVSGIIVKIRELIEIVRNIDLKTLFENKIKPLIEYVKNIDLSKISNSSMFGGIINAFDAVGEFLSKNTSIPERLTQFINSVINALSNIDYGKIAKTGAMIFVITSIAKYIFAVNSLGNAIDAVAQIPVKIGEFISNLGTSISKFANATKYAAMAYMIASIAKALLIAAGAIIALSFVDSGKLYEVATLIAILAFVFKSLISSLSNMLSTMSNGVLDVKSFIYTVGLVASMISIIKSLSSAFAAIIKELAIFAVAAPIEKMAAAIVVTYFISQCITDILTTCVVIIRDIPTIVKVQKVLPLISKFFVMYAAAMLIISAGVALLGSISVGRLAVATIAALAISSAMEQMLKSCLRAANSFESARRAEKVLPTIASFLIALSASFVIAAYAIAKLGSVKVGNLVVSTLAVIVISASMERFLEVSIKLLKNYQIASRAEKVLPTIASFLIALSASFVIAAYAIAKLGSVKVGNLVVATIAMITISTVMDQFLETSLKLLKRYNIAARVEKILPSIASFLISLSAALLIASYAISRLGNLDISNLIVATVAMYAIMHLMMEFIKFSINMSNNYHDMLRVRDTILKISASIVLISIAVAILATSTTLLAVVAKILSFGDIIKSTAILLASAYALKLVFDNYSKLQSSAKGAISAALMMSIALIIMTAAITIISKTQPDILSALIVAGLMISLAVAISIIAKTVSKYGASSDALLNVGIMMMSISIAMIILAEAIKKFSTTASTGILSFVAVMGVLLAFIIVLGMLDKVSSGGITKIMETIGSFFLFLGVGAALVGVGMLLVATGFKMFANALKTLAPILEVVFTSIENHWGAFIIGSLVLVVVIGLIVAGIVELASVIKPIVELVVKGLTAILDAFKSFSKSAGDSITKTSKGLSTQTKTAIVGIIGGLLAAIVSATPETLKTIGEVIIKVLKWLGTIAGDIAEGLVNFLIEVINGVADAIMNNSSRIWAALKSVLYAIADLVLQILGGIIADIADWFGAGNKVRDFINGTSEELMRKSLETRKAAEASAEAKKEVYNNIRGVADDTEDASESTSKSNARSIFSFLGLGNSSELAADQVGAAMEDVERVTGQTSDQVEKNLAKQQEALEKLKESAFYDTLANANTGAALDAAKRNLSSGYNKKAFETAGKNSGTSFANGFNLGSQSTMVPDMSEYFGENSDLNLDMSEYGAGMGEEYGTAFGETTTTTATAELYNPEVYSETMDANMEDGIISSIADHKDEVEATTRTSVTDTINSQIEGNRNQLKESAKYMWRGFYEGTEVEQPVIMNSVAQMVAEIKKTMTGPDGLDEHSPSKVAYGWGRYLVMGLAEGVRNSTSLATDSAAELSDAMIVSFGAPLDYLAKIASGELVYDPSIRPVIDSSAIRSGAGTINSMIGAQQIQLSGYSGQLAADISQLDSSNLRVVEELQQLRADMADMTEQITNMQMVMDTGALVGQISGPIDRSLGRSMIRKGRGN